MSFQFDSIRETSVEAMRPAARFVRSALGATRWFVFSESDLRLAADIRPSVVQGLTARSKLDFKPSKFGMATSLRRCF